MNGVHDMGGMHGFGPVKPEENEPVFHAPWEGRVYGMVQALGPHRIHDPHGMRFALESLEPATYLASSYYERWLLTTEQALVDKGILTEQELESKTEFFKTHPDANPERREDTELRERILRAAYRRYSPRPETDMVPRFQVGDSVIVRNIHPRGHTRLPRYVRGKRGAIFSIYGVHNFQDTVPEGATSEPQPVYSVSFDARELWGDAAEANQSLYIDMWESYLHLVETP